MSSRRILHGVAICNGLLVGRLAWAHHPPEHTFAKNSPLSPDQEWARFLIARRTALEKLEQLLADAHEPTSARAMDRKTQKEIREGAAVIEGYILLLSDDFLIEHVRQMVFEDGFDAPSAIEKIFITVAKPIESSNHEHLKEKSFDLAACRDLMLSAMERNTDNGTIKHLQNRIVIIDHPTPQDVIRLHQAGVGAIVAERGSHLSHAAILARSFNIPTLFSVKGSLKNCRNGQLAILNTSDESLVINPSSTEIRKTEARRAVGLLMNQKLRTQATLSAETIDGRHVSVFANTDGPPDARQLRSFGAEGIGLMRTEFLHLAHHHQDNSAPSLNESIIFFRTAASFLAPHCLTVRLLDAGGDKPYPSGYNHLSKSPFGLRGIRFLISEKSILEAQLSALIQANKQGNIKILIPFVTDVSEVQHVKRKAQHIWQELPHEVRSGLQFPKIGAMIETPSAAQILEHLAAECDFLSIGSNDLTQHILCVDRANDQESRQLSSYHPAVLKTLKTIFDAQNNFDTPISLCGELASDPVATELLIGLGCRQLSTSASAIPLIKDLIRRTSCAESEVLAQQVLKMRSADEIQELLGERYEKSIHTLMGQPTAKDRAS